jgi:hypothetical protein
MIKRERDFERELADLFRSMGRGSVYYVGGEPFIDFVRSHEPANEDGTIYEAGISSLSLAVLARRLIDTIRELETP